MKWNVTDDAVFILEREHRPPLRVQADGRERDDALFVEHAIVITNRELAFAEFDVPPDAMEQVLERLHLAASYASGLATPTVCARSNCWSASRPIASDSAWRSNQARMTVASPADAAYKYTFCAMAPAAVNA